MIKILAGGKKSTQWVLDAVNEYNKRLRPPFDCQWLFCDEDKLPEKIAKLNPADFLIILDEQGTILDSISLTQKITAPLLANQNLVILIGGAFGHFSPAIKQRANFTWSLSKLVFPHQLCRILIAEQIYRCQEIYLNHPYHHA